MTDASKAAGKLKAVEKRPLHQLIVQQIQALIAEGKLKAGDRLPTERELAGIFKVSRHTVREAIRSLEQQNILKSRVGSGTYVVLEEEQLLSEALSAYIARERDKLAEIFQFRRLIEPQIASLAASNATDADVKALEEMLQEQRERALQADTTSWAELDQRFHLAIARATGNSVLTRVVELINGLLDVCREEAYRSQKRLRQSTKGHAAIVEAIGRHAPQEAAKAMAAHLEAIERLILPSGG